MARTKRVLAGHGMVFVPKHELGHYYHMMLQRSTETAYKENPCIYTPKGEPARTPSEGDEPDTIGVFPGAG